MKNNTSPVRAEIKIDVVVNSSIQQVAPLLTTESGIAAWWTCDAKVDATSGGRATFPFAKSQVSGVVRSVSPAQICVSFDQAIGMDEWVGTTLTITARESASGTVVELIHDGWKKDTAYVAWSAGTWRYFLKSLQLKSEKGAGTPFSAKAPSLVLLGLLAKMPFLKLKYALRLNAA